MKAIETVYAGCRFRSRLEARWAVFFDHLGIPWEYEPQGFELTSGRRYLPDFLLTDCGTWVEVKGSDEQLDRDLMRQAAYELDDPPPSPYEAGPHLLILGPHPRPNDLDWGWVSISRWGDDVELNRVGFGLYHKNSRPWWHDSADHITVVPELDRNGEPGVPDAYQAARSARFEHGERGAR